MQLRAIESQVALFSECKTKYLQATVSPYGVVVHFNCLQVERGTTATYLSSAGGNAAAMLRLQTIRNNTDQLTSALDEWPPDGLVVGGTSLQTKQVRYRPTPYFIVAETQSTVKNESDVVNSERKVL